MSFDTAVSEIHEHRIVPAGMHESPFALRSSQTFQEGGAKAREQLLAAEIELSLQSFRAHACIEPGKVSPNSFTQLLPPGTPRRKKEYLREVAGRIEQGRPLPHEDFESLPGHVVRAERLLGLRSKVHRQFKESGGGRARHFGLDTLMRTAYSASVGGAVALGKATGKRTYTLGPSLQNLFYDTVAKGCIDPLVEKTAGGITRVYAMFAGTGGRETQMMDALETRYGKFQRWYVEAAQLSLQLHSIFSGPRDPENKCVYVHQYLNKPRLQKMIHDAPEGSLFILSGAAPTMSHGDFEGLLRTFVQSLGPRQIGYVDAPTTTSRTTDRFYGVGNEVVDHLAGEILLLEPGSVDQFARTERVLGRYADSSVVEMGIQFPEAYRLFDHYGSNPVAVRPDTKAGFLKSRRYGRGTTVPTLVERTGAPLINENAEAVAFLPQAR